MYYAAVIGWGGDFEKNPAHLSTHAPTIEILDYTLLTAPRKSLAGVVSRFLQTRKETATTAAAAAENNCVRTDRKADALKVSVLDESRLT